MTFAITQHASTRMHQRAVPNDVLDLLLCYGAAASAGGGALRIWFDRAARDEIMAHSADITLRSEIERWFNVVAIVSSNGNVITVMRSPG